MDFNSLRLNTKSDYFAFVERLDNSSDIETLKHNLPEDQFNVINEVVNAGSSLEEIKKDIKLYINKQKEIVIYTSFEPSKDFVEKALDIFANLSKGHIFDFRVDKTIIGGAKLVLDGKLYDESMQKRIKEILMSQNGK